MRLADHPFLLSRFIIPYIGTLPGVGLSNLELRKSGRGMIFFATRIPTLSGNGLERILAGREAGLDVHHESRERVPP